MKQNIKRVHRGEIYWCDLGEAVGSEQGGCRPVIIVQNDIGNNFSTTTIVVPLTTKIKKTKLPTHHEFVNNGVKQVACAEQIRTVDKLRLGTNLGFVRKEDVDEISRCVHIAVEEIKFQPKPYGKVEADSDNLPENSSFSGKEKVEEESVDGFEIVSKEVIYPFVRKGDVFHATADGCGTVEKAKDVEKSSGKSRGRGASGSGQKKKPQSGNQREDNGQPRQEKSQGKTVPQRNHRNNGKKHGQTLSDKKGKNTHQISKRNPMEKDMNDSQGDT